ncbi:hypothetical protein [Candidatus Coxiella mudrowiae]|uniref:hypothetical protein n=1 Tax=Candidatus Coxiella mudrowiae TaxID=2054173 RepID=UPI000C287449|nr:hypothetical protein [Candidatus Coxiella mudrowiae]
MELLVKNYRLKSKNVVILGKPYSTYLAVVEQLKKKWISYHSITATSPMGWYRDEVIGTGTGARRA